MDLTPHDGALWDDSIDPATVVPRGFSTGLLPRDYSKYPQGCFASAPPFPDSELIPENEWADRHREKVKNQSSMLHYREAYYELMKSLDQDGQPLCWAFSSTKAAMWARAMMGLPPLRFSGWYTAGMASGWRSRGGWGSESVEQGANGGFCTLEECPSYSSRYATPDNATKAATRKITSFWDGSESSALARKQAVSAFLTDRACVIDLNAMSHSMCAIWFNPDPFEIIYDNSWGEGGDRGLYKGRGAYASPNGLWIVRQLRAS